MGTHPINLRDRGPRAFEEMPPGEVLVASRIALKKGTFRNESEEHLHATLNLLSLKRLTTRTGSRMLDILKLEPDYLAQWLRDHIK